MALIPAAGTSNVSAVEPNPRVQKANETAVQKDSFQVGDLYFGEWRISDFSSEKRLVSPHFLILNLKFHFSWERNLYQHTGKECFEIFLNYEHLSEQRKLSFVQINIHLKDRFDNRTSESFHIEKLPDDKSYYRVWCEEIKTVNEQLSDWEDFVDVVFRIQVKMGRRVDIRDRLVLKRYIDPEIFSYILSTDSLKLLKTGDMADITLKCGERTIQAHKLILSIRSKRFSELILNNEEPLNINDMDSFILDQVLYYIYSGKIPDVPNDRLVDLYKAAYRYGIEGLTTGCASMLIVKLETDRLLQVLPVADEFSDDWFKEQAGIFLEEKRKSREEEYAVSSEGTSTSGQRKKRKLI